MAEIKYLYLVMPSVPPNLAHLYAHTQHLLQGQGIWNGPQQSAIPTPYVFLHTPDAAHDKARELAKQHHIPYHVAKVELIGQFVPPPPAWVPIYEVWSKP